jgi:hypothetical protein
MACDQIRILLKPNAVGLETGEIARGMKIKLFLSSLSDHYGWVCYLRAHFNKQQLPSVVEVNPNTRPNVKLTALAHK